MFKIIKYPNVKFVSEYKINEKGEVFSTHYNRLMKVWPDKDGYLRVSLSVIDSETGKHKRRNFPIHRLVLYTFKPIDNLSEMQVNHIDNNRMNPSLENLEWVTAKENVKHMLNQKRGRVQRQNGENNHMSILTEEDIKEIIEMLLLPNRPTYKRIAHIYHVSEDTIGTIKRKERWTHLTKDINFD